MKNRVRIFGILFSVLYLSLASYGKNIVPRQQAVAFSLKDVHLTTGAFRHAMELDEQWLLSFEPDRFLSGFRSESGLNPKAPKYGGWESQGVAGQTFGHYLSALSMMYAATGNEALNDRIRYSVNELDSCQQAFDLNGLVAGFPDAKKLFQEIMEGDIRTEGFDLNGSWVPLYNIHKLFAGLIDVYRFTGSRQAYDVLLNLANGFEHMMSGLNDLQIQKILICEHGGINESMAEMYALTGDRRFIVLAQRLNHRAIIDPLMNKKDELAGKHANTQIPKIIGVIREYELTGNRTYFDIADFFWNTVVHHHSYVIGGNSEAEHFGVPDRTCDRLSDKTCENCNTYNMLKLTKHLFMLNPSADKADYYERALYNQILASQNAETGMVCYMSPLSTGSARHYSTPFDSFWCCVGTGLENHARYGEFIYFSDRQDNLLVNLFIPSVLDWKKRNIKFIQKTSYPESDTIRFMLKADRKQKFTIRLRYPSWAQDGFSLYVNGDIVKSKADRGSYIDIERCWHNGDEICYILPKSIESEPALGDESLRAYLYGPVVLSGVLEKQQDYYPVIVSDDLNNIDPVMELSGKGLVFDLKKSQPYRICMKPYYQRKDSLLMVYFEHYSTQDWNNRQEDILLKQNYERWIEKQTVSTFSPGEMQPERDHHFRGKKTGIGEVQGRKYRNAVDGGWFSFDMQVLPDQPIDISAVFWGNLGDIYKFAIEIDGFSVATVIIHWWGNAFIEKTYHIPEQLTHGKNKVEVTFRALDERSVAGPLFGCKILKRN